MRFLLLLLIAYTFEASETNNYFYNISYNDIYRVELSRFYPLDYIPKANLYFTMPVENLQVTNLDIQVSKSDKIDFKVKVSGFYQQPTESEIIKGNDNIELEPREKNTMSDIILYTFRLPTLKKQDKIKYLVVTILNNEPMHYLLLGAFFIKKLVEQTIYNITYKKEEILNKTTLSKHKGVFIFILENKDLGKNKLCRLKLKQELSLEKTEVAGFKERPYTEEMLKNPVSSDVLLLKSTKKDGNYYIYEFLIKKEEINKQKYIGIALRPDVTLDFMSLYIGPES